MAGDDVLVLAVAREPSGEIVDKSLAAPMDL
ncbi:MAG: hypothetical protein JWM71_888, partial [Solirubrobacteraceae bacterium]|nr:hypothetical protein [Solirubrobacteraceae bacterium]